MPVKQCFTCGSPVADAALGRGAVETAEGRRYCSPCAARLKLDLSTEADAVRSVSPAPPPAPAAVPVRPAAPETVRTAAKPPAPVRPPAPARTGGSARSRPTVRNKPKARQTSSAARKPTRRPSSRLGKPGSRGERRAPAEPPSAEGIPTSRLTSRRAPRVDVPWYFRLTRSQIAGIAAVAVALILLLAIGGIAASCRMRPNRQGSVAHGPVPYSGAPTQMMERARVLVGEGKIDEALRVLEKAKASAQKNGQDYLVVEINRQIYGLRFKTAR